ncbi:MAG: response regulator [bacterium]|nr:response regulator [bacterium]
MDPPPRATILLVDDDKKSLAIVTDLLEYEGYEVFTAGNGREALDRLAEREIDLVVTDYEMPVMNGFELLKSVNRGYPELPVIVLTGQHREDVQTAISTLKEGAYDYILKPVDLGRLRKSVRTALDLRQARRESHALHEVLTTTLAELNRKNEKYEELTRIHNELLKILSRDLETPFTILTGSCKILRNELGSQLSAEHQKMIEEIGRQEANLEATIRDLLDLAVVDTDEIEIHKVEARLHTLLDKCVNSLAGVAGNKGISFALQPPTGLKTVYMDVGRMKQVFFNLLHQAIHLSRNNQTIRIGILPGTHEQTVEILFAGNHVQTRDINNVLSGDGEAGEMAKPMRYRLSLCREIVELHEGKIWAEESLEGEILFCAKIPNLFLRDEAARGVRPSPSPPGAPSQ